MVSIHLSKAVRAVASRRTAMNDEIANVLCFHTLLLLINVM